MAFEFKYLGDSTTRELNKFLRGVNGHRSDMHNYLSTKSDARGDLSIAHVAKKIKHIVTEKGIFIEVRGANKSQARKIAYSLAKRVKSKRVLWVNTRSNIIAYGLAKCVKARRAPWVHKRSNIREIVTLCYY